jgi:predicted AAA+ superfamily ATPase
VEDEPVFISKSPRWRGWCIEKSYIILDISIIWRDASGMIKRGQDRRELLTLMEEFPVTAILGPRQSGKTTLAREFATDHFFDLESPADLAMFSDPQMALSSLSGLIVIDEIQRVPELFPLIRHLVDTRKDQRYLILGSASGFDSAVVRIACRANCLS